MTITAKIIPGHGAASGKKGDHRYPGGTIAIQAPYFKKLGLDLTGYHPGTLNIDVSPFNYQIKSPKYFFNQVEWTKHIPPENFYFFDVTVDYKMIEHRGLIYMPDPKTKTEHEQSRTTLELILPKVDEINYGDIITISVNKNQLELLP